MNFPKINYKYWFDNWVKNVGSEKVYTNKNMVKYIIFNGDSNDCTNEISELTATNKLDREKVLRVVDLIYSWGGKSGRMFYVSKNNVSPRQNLKENTSTFEDYLCGVELAKKGKPQCIYIFNSIPGIGSSYASKHAYFWSLKSDNPLIIIDSKIVGTLGFNNIEQFEKQYNYSKSLQLFKEKAKVEFNQSDPSKVEKALFAFHNYYFLNDNSGWKNEDKEGGKMKIKRVEIIQKLKI